MALWRQDQGLLWWSANSATNYSGSAYATKGNVYRAKKTIRIHRAFSGFGANSPNTYFGVLAVVDFDGASSSVISIIKHKGANFTVGAAGLYPIFVDPGGFVIEGGQIFAVLSVNTGGATAVNRVSFPATQAAALYETAAQQIEYVHCTRHELANPGIDDEVYFNNTSGVFDIIDYGA